MPDPKIAQREPIPVEVKEGRSYWWCTCGQSAKQPFCDGTHKGSGFEPMEYKALKAGKVWFCACKHTGKSPMCDGTHAKL